MTKTIHNTFKVLLITLCLYAPLALQAQDVQHSQIEAEQNQVTVTASNATLHVKNAEGMTLEIFSLTGEKVFTQRIEGSPKNFDLAHLPHGYYIVKIGKYTRKIYLR